MAKKKLERREKRSPAYTLFLCDGPAFIETSLILTKWDED